MAERPNLLLLVPDQLRADAVGAFGNPVVRTPHVDALAAAGTAFPNAWAQHSVCSQSRISMFTGWYPHVAGHRTLTHLLAPHEPNVLRALREGGYHVALAGARGDMLGAGVTEASSDRFGFTVRPSLDALAHLSTSPYPEDHRWFGAFYHGRLDEDPLDLDEATVRTAVDWLTEGMPEPWCLLVALLAPHPPFAVADPWYSLHDRSEVPAPVPPTFAGKPRFVRAIHDAYRLDRLDEDDWREVVATYYGMVARVDDQVGRVLAALDRSGARDRTVTWFFTDHGEYLGDFGLVEKWMSGVDDCLLREPLVVHDPNAGAGGRAEGLVEMVDLTATLLDLAGVDAGWSHFGRSLRPLLADPSAPHRDAAFSEGGFTVAKEPLLESGAGGHYRAKQELQHADPSLTGRAIAVRTERWTYVERLYEGPELYDRAADPRETTNLAGRPEHAALVPELRDRCFGWLFETSDVIPWEPDPRLDPALLATFLPAARPR